MPLQRTITLDVRDLIKYKYTAESVRKILSLKYPDAIVSAVQDDHAKTITWVLAGPTPGWPE